MRFSRPRHREVLAEPIEAIRQWQADEDRVIFLTVGYATPADQQIQRANFNRF